MPTQRFLNLPEEKRIRIIDAAVDEFVGKGIDGADVAGVVRRAGIPRGSFYQYFADMNDLLGQIFEHFSKVKMQYMADVFVRAEETPFTDYVEQSFRCAMRFAESHPRLVTLSRRIHSSTNPLVAQWIETGRRMAIEHYAPLIERDKARGLIRETMDPQILAAFVMNVYTEIIGSMVLRQCEGRGDAMAVADMLFEILRYGIQTAKGAC